MYFFSSFITYKICSIDHKFKYIAKNNFTVLRLFNDFIKIIAIIILIIIPNYNYKIKPVLPVIMAKTMTINHFWALLPNLLTCTIMPLLFYYPFFPEEPDILIVKLCISKHIRSEPCCFLKRCFPSPLLYIGMMTA